MNEKRRILIVDDDSMIRRSLCRILKINNYETFEAADGLEAVKIVEQVRPDLLVLDIRMPGIDGVETFFRIRKLLPSVPAVFMTAYSSSDKAVAASNAGGLCVLMKPLDVSGLMDVIGTAVAEAPVLIVDDQEDFLLSLARALDSQGIENVTASSIKEAVAQLRMRPRRVVIADVFLEDGNGLELLAEIDTACSPPPLVLVTGHADWFGGQEAPKKLGDAGVQCIEKPLDIPKLIATIDALRQSVT